MTVKTLGLKELIHPFNEENVTPPGYDFSVSAVFTYVDFGGLWKDRKSVPEYEEMEAINDCYNLGPGPYMVRFAEMVEIPKNCMAIMHPRSTLLRCGVSLETAVWDAGYVGISSTLMVVHNPAGFLLAKGARVGHMTFHQLDRAVGGYSGSYQGEGLTVQPSVDPASRVQVSDSGSILAGMADYIRMKGEAG
jgi:dUTP pyrophosphatase